MSSSTSRAVLKVLNISWTCARSDLKTHFKKYGKIQRINIPMDRVTGFNRKIAFVEIEGNEGFAENISQDYHIIDDQEVTVSSMSMDEVPSIRETHDLTHAPE